MFEICRGNFQLLQDGSIIYAGQNSKIFSRQGVVYIQDLVGGGIIASFPNPYNDITLNVLSNFSPTPGIQEPTYCYPTGPTGPAGPAGPNLVSTTTPTTINGLLGGNGTNVVQVAVGSGLTLSGGTLSISGGGTGTVTSVAMTVPSFLSVSGSPITTSGTLAVSLNTETANTFFAGPSSGGATIPSFRAIVSADIPILNQNTTGQAGTVATINGLVAAGSNITLTGSGTTSSPYTISGTAGGVTSFNTRTGAVTLSSSDVTTALTYTPAKPVTAITHEWINSINSSGVPQLSQPAFSDISGQIATSQVPTLNQNTTGQAGTVATINGLIAAGTNITLTGSGTSASPYTIASSGGGSSLVSGTTTITGGVSGGVAYEDSGGHFNITAQGTAGEILFSNGSSAPSFQAFGLGGVPTSNGLAGAVIYVAPNGYITQSNGSGFFYDDGGSMENFTPNTLYLGLSESSAPGIIALYDPILDGYIPISFSNGSCTLGGLTVGNMSFVNSTITGNLIFDSTSSSNPNVSILAQSSQTNDLTQWANSTQTTVYSRINYAGRIISNQTTAPAGTDLNIGDATFWNQDTAGAPIVIFTCKDSAGATFNRYFGACAQADLTSQSASLTSLVSFTPVATGTFRVGVYTDVRSITAGSLAVSIAWYDETGTSRSQSFTTVAATPATSVTAVGFYVYSDFIIRAGTGGPIKISTIKTGTISYDIGGQVEQLR